MVRNRIEDEVRRVGGTIRNSAALIGDLHARVGDSNAQTPDPNARLAGLNARIPKLNARIRNSNAQIRNPNARTGDLRIQIVGMRRVAGRSTSIGAAGTRSTFRPFNRLPGEAAVGDLKFMVLRPKISP
jgi:hypothetical protein